MASIFKPKGRNKYRIQYVDPATGKTKTVPGYTDKTATETKARQLERRAEREAAGMPVAAQEKRQAPIADLLDAYQDDLTRLDRDKTYIRETRRVLDNVSKACGWTTLAAVRPDAFTRYLAGLQRSPRTKNYQRSAWFGFLEFCRTQGWAEDNPFKNIRPSPNRKVRFRRAFTAEEFSRLCKVHSRRGTIYLIAGLSGFRLGELAKMQKRDLTPSGACPTWHPRGEITKARRADRIPILPDLVPHLAEEWESLAHPASLLFQVMPRTKTFHRDLATAKIPRMDDAGRVADFHSLRYFFCTQLAKVMPIQTVQRFMRHSDVRLTSSLYNDLGITDLWAAAQQLPTLNLSLPTIPPATLPLTLPPTRKPQETRTKEVI